MSIPLADGVPEPILRVFKGTPPTQQQWEAISHPLTPSAVVAGAGSGKTAVMVARVVYLALVRAGVVEAGHRGAAPSEILCLTFTNKAAEELGRRVRHATEELRLPDGEEPTVHTYHAFAARMLDEYGLRMGLEPGGMLLTEAHKWQLAVSLLNDREFEHLEVRTVRHVVENLLLLADECANHRVDPLEVAERSRAFAQELALERAGDRKIQLAALRRAELAEVAHAYGERKRALGVIDYADQIELACRLAEEHPEVGEAFRDRYKVVLLDEYQDTNVAQAQLLSLLCGRGHPVMAVGDPDQNIYAWRGASLQNILRFHEDFSGGDPAERRPLYLNFRSGSRILGVADTVIGRVPDERRAPDKRLEPHPERGEGRVRAFVAADERSEGRRIAELIRETLAARERTADGELRWEDVAILCRKKRLFGSIYDVLREEGIPVEVVDLGGLLQLPEVVDVVSWLRLLDDPGRNVGLARVLQGPRWRIGYRDLVALARWSLRRNRDLAHTLPGEDPSPGDVSFPLAEALEHLDDPDITGLSPEARERLTEFRGVLADLQEAARGPLDELAVTVIERSGLLRELEASGNPSAVGARRNLLNLVQHISSFAPVEGEASLSTLIAYLDAAQEREDELEPVQVSEANTVKMLTIHKAKGLEWPVVFVPGLAEGKASAIFPDVSRQPNPLEQAHRVPFAMRGDRDLLPQYDGKMDEFKQALKERGLEEERRLCYVALTRARDELIVSTAGWYQGPQTPFAPSVFFEEVAGEDACEVLPAEEIPEESPLLAARLELAAAWPGPARPDDADELFPEGPVAAAAAGYAEARAERLSPAEQASFHERLGGHRERAALIRERATADRGPAVPRNLSVTSVLGYLRCPKLFYWSVVRPLPRRSSAAARRGTEVHRWIELQGRGQASLLDLDALPDLSTDERLAEPQETDRLKDAFRASRFADQVPLHTERPFTLYLDGIVVGGRIDAIYARPDGGWEVVDYKTGRKPEEDEVAGLQLDLYALACAEIWGKKPEELTLTYLYLGDGQEVTRRAGDVEETRKRILDALGEMTAGRFDATPGPQCRWCDFLSFCEPGKRHVQSRA